MRDGTDRENANTRQHAKTHINDRADETPIQMARLVDVACIDPYVSNTVFDSLGAGGRNTIGNTLRNVVTAALRL
jgi:hypothetical protein